MANKKRKLVACSVLSFGLALVVLGAAAAFTSLNNAEVLRIRADPTNGSVSYDNNSRVGGFGDRYYSFKATSARGTDIYLISRSYYNASNVLANFSNQPEDYIGFYEDNSLDNEFVFQNISSITIGFTGDTDNGAGFDVLYTKGGVQLTRSAVTVKGGSVTISDIAGATKVRIDPTFSNNAWFKINNITLSYTCDPNS